MQTTAQGRSGLPDSVRNSLNWDKTTLWHLEFGLSRAFGLAVVLHAIKIVNPWYLLGTSFCGLVVNLRFWMIYEDAPGRSDHFRLHYNLISFIAIVSAFVLSFEQMKRWVPWLLLRIALGEVIAFCFRPFLHVLLCHSPNGWRIEREQIRLAFREWTNGCKSLDSGISSKIQHTLLSIRLVLSLLFTYLFLTIAWICMLVPRLKAMVPRKLFHEFNHLLRFALTGDLPESEPGQYQYEPILSPDGYRLIEMERWRPFKTLKFKLLHCDLTTPKTYEAISYCWGNPAKVRKIRVNEKIMLVPQSTYEVLHGRSSFWRSRRIWLDAVCINQADNEEKSRQVRMMKRIYENAERVVVWLGGSSLVTFIGIALLEEIIDYMKEYNFSGDEVHDRYFIERFGFRWCCLDLILNQPWFFRLWIIQEASAAKAVHVVSGCFYIDFAVFETVSRLAWDPVVTTLITSTAKGRASRMATGNVSTISDIRERLENPQQLPSLDAVFQRYILENQAGSIEALADAREALLEALYSAEADQTRLLNLLLECGNFKATDKRDYVFALFGLAKDVGGSNPDLAPDYSQDTCEVYEKLALFFLKGSEPFARLCTTGIGYRRSIKSLPSWVPDLSQPRQCWELDKPHFGPNRYKACGDTRAEVSFFEFMSMSACSVKAVQVTRVKVVGHGMSEHNEDNEQIFGDGYLSFAKKFLDGCNWRYENYMLAVNHAKPVDVSTSYKVSELSEEKIALLAIGEPFWRTLMGNRSTDSYPATARSARDFSESVNLRSWFGKHNGLPKDEDMSSVERQRLLDRDLQMPQDEDFRRRILNLADWAHSVTMVAGGRKFAVMEDGSMGMVPSGAEIGDEVYVFCGARIPVLLRPWRADGLGNAQGEVTGSEKEDLSSDHGGGPEQQRLWQLVGDCYVYGIMDGEAFAGSDVKLEQVILI